MVGCDIKSNECSRANLIIRYVFQSTLYYTLLYALSLPLPLVVTDHKPTIRILLSCRLPPHPSPLFSSFIHAHAPSTVKFGIHFAKTVTSRKVVYIRIYRLLYNR